MSDAELRYTFTCPSCKGSFSIQLERIPPVQARFRCPHCKQPMDFPSREEARVYARLQTEPEPAAQAPKLTPPPGPASRTPPPRPTVADPAPPETATGEGEGTRFRLLKTGYEADVYDRRAIRNLIRTGEIEENDQLEVDEGKTVNAAELPSLKSLFTLRKTARGKPPRVCRTHTESVAFYKCHDTGRPLCEECSLEKKFGATIVRVCQHCGGTADLLDETLTVL